MSVQRLTDNRAMRAMTVADADALVREIALLTVKIAKIEAGYEKKIADLKAAANRETEGLEADLRGKVATLTGYIQANPERFIKPRQHATDYGKYGVRTVSNLEITDEEAVKLAVKALGIPALVVTERLDKKALEKAIGDGQSIDGCELRRGEIASYTVAKALLEE